MRSRAPGGASTRRGIGAAAALGVEFEEGKPSVVIPVEVTQHHRPEVVAGKSLGAKGRVATRSRIEQKPERAADRAQENGGLPLPPGPKGVAGAEKPHLDACPFAALIGRPGSSGCRPLAVPADERPAALTLRRGVQRAIATPAAFEPGRGKRGRVALEQLRDEGHDAIPVTGREEPGVFERVLVRPGPDDQPDLDGPSRAVLLVGIGEDPDFEQRRGRSG